MLLDDFGLPGKPMVYDSGLLSRNYGLPYGVVASHFGQLGFPGGAFL